jgi:hypothetical protein
MWSSRSLRRRDCGKSPKPSIRSRSSRRPLFESLELRRVLAAYTWSDFFGTLAIQLATNESLTVTESAGTATFTLSTGTFTNNGGDAAPGDGTAAIAIPVGDLTESITIDNSLASGGTTNVIFNGAGSLTSESISVSLLDSDAVGTVAMQGGFDLVSNGAAGIAFTSQQGVFVDTGSSVSTVDGDINLQGNANGSSSGNFNGVIMNGTFTSTGAGDIIAVGHGANASGSDRQRGIFIFGGQIQSTGTGAISLTGTGGNGGTENCVGISLESNAQITSAAGDITIDATGGNGSSAQNAGLVMVTGATIVATGEANVSVTGVGGSGSDQCVGVVLFGTGVGISTVDGDLELSGTATDAASANTIGVWLTASAVVATSGAGNMTIIGQSAQFVVPGIQIDSSAAVNLAGSNTANLIADGISIAAGSLINAAQSAITLKTKTTNGSIGIDIGGADSATALGISNDELNRITARTIVIGDDDTPNTITVSAAILHTGDANFGVLTARNIAMASGSSWTTANGNLLFEANRQLVSTADDFIGISLNAATVTTNGTGNVLLQGRGGDGGIQIDGISLISGSVIQSTALATSAGTITIDGIGGNGNSGNFGIHLNGDGTKVTSVAGDISITGRGGDGTAGSNDGVLMNGGVVVSSTGSDASAATITINGFAAAGTSNNIGVFLTDPGTQVLSTSGNISITGQGGGSGTGPTNYGVLVQNFAIISSTGSGPSAAAIAIVGTGGNGTSGNTGVFIAGDSSISSVDGPIDITATAGLNTPIDLTVQNSATINVTGSGIVTLIADGIDIAAAINAALSTVNLQPLTAGFAVNLGGADSATELGLTDTELDLVTTLELVIGSANAGTIDVTADITRTAETNVRLSAGGDTVFSAGQVSTAGGRLLLDAPVTGTAVKPTKAGTDATAENALVAADLAIAINGTTVDTDYDQLNVAGTISLPLGQLILSGSYVPQSGDVFTIVSASEIEGQFNGLDNGDKILFNGVELTIGYHGPTITLRALRDADDIIVLGAETGAQPRVKVLDSADGSEIVNFLAYNSAFAGGVRVAVADMNGDGQAEIIVAPGAGISTLVKVFTLEGNELLEYRTKAYTGFSGGVFVATGDVNGDGRSDLITAPGSGLSAQIKVFKNRTGIDSPNTDPISNNAIFAFLAFGGTFTGGATVAAGDLTGDGKAEVVVGNGPGMGSRVRVYDLATLVPPVNTITVAPFTLEIRPFDPADRGGVFVAVGDTRGNATPEIIVGNGVNGRGRVEIYNANGTRSNSFTAYGEGEGRNAPVHVAAKNIDADTLDEILAGQGAPGSTGKLRSFDHDGTIIDDLLEGEGDFRFGFFVA